MQHNSPVENYRRYFHFEKSISLDGIISEDVRAGGEYLAESKYAEYDYMLQINHSSINTHQSFTPLKQIPEHLFDFSGLKNFDFRFGLFQAFLVVF